MSKYFAFINDVAYDYKFKKRSDGSYLFSLGNYPICILYPMLTRARASSKTWSVVVQGHLEKEVPRLVNGFASRHKAIEYALKVHLLTKK